MTADRILRWTPAAIVFDCDGTLMDSERHWVRARELTLNGFDIALDPEVAERAKGLHYTDCGRFLAETSGIPDLVPEVTECLLEHFRELVADDPVALPGAVELVRRTASFAPLAVASNCPRDVVESGLSHAGMLDYFSHVVVPDGEVRAKPQPDVYLEATRRCGAAPGDSLAVEDSYAGILSATGAGLRVVGVGPHGGREERAAVDLWVRSLDDPALLGWAKERARSPLPRQTGTERSGSLVTDSNGEAKSSATPTAPGSGSPTARSPR